MTGPLSSVAKIVFISIWLTSTINNTYLLLTENCIFFITVFCIYEGPACFIFIVTITWRLLVKLNEVKLKRGKDRRKILKDICTESIWYLILRGTYFHISYIVHVVLSMSNACMILSCRTHLVLYNVEHT